MKYLGLLLVMFLVACSSIISNPPPEIPLIATADNPLVVDEKIVVPKHGQQENRIAYYNNNTNAVNATVFETARCTNEPAHLTLAILSIPRLIEPDDEGIFSIYIKGLEPLTSGNNVCEIIVVNVDTREVLAEKQVTVKIA